MTKENFANFTPDHDLLDARVNLIDSLTEARDIDAGALAERFAKPDHDVDATKYKFVGIPEQDLANPRTIEPMNKSVFRENSYLENLAKDQSIELADENTLSQTFVLDGADGGLVLSFNGVPSVNAGYEVEMFHGRPALKIVQLQQVYLSYLNYQRIKLPNLTDVRWEKMLIAASEQLAKNAGFDQVVIQSAANNHMVQKYAERRREGFNVVRGISEEQGKMRYDTTAKRMKYQLDEATGDYVRDI
jgi:hypothetical protein